MQTTNIVGNYKLYVHLQSTALQNSHLKLEIINGNHELKDKVNCKTACDRLTFGHIEKNYACVEAILNYKR